jgi:hypothetical protein
MAEGSQKMQLSAVYTLLTQVPEAGAEEFTQRARPHLEKESAGRFG